MRNVVTTRLLLFLLFCVIAMVISNNHAEAQTINENSSAEDSEHLAEDLWASIDFISIRKTLLDSTKMSAADLDLFMNYISVKYDYAEADFFKNVLNGSINIANLPQYVLYLTHEYISAYPDFLKIKMQFALQQSAAGNNTLSINGPCVNTDFSDGTTNGWQGYLAKACATSPAPCTQVAQVAGYTGPRISVVPAGTFDPYIPVLSRVAPGKTFSVHLEDYLNGANASVLSQTFMVTATNNVFTYQYAVVLEDPGNNHTQAQRPYFKVRMQDDLGNEITCADYTVWAQAPYTNFVHYPAPNPNPGVNGGPAIMDLYYRDWTTVSIPLLGYVGRNVTIEFMASDCSLGGHRGYAYIDATCSYLTPIIPPLICGSTENYTVHGPLNFAAYKWSGPGIVGSSTTDSVMLNKAGNYSVLLTPVADNPCPITVSFIVPERCLPTPATVPICETVLGSGKANNVNLSNYNKLITSYNSSGTVKSWHSAIPANASNLIVIPSNLTVQTGSSYYAVIAYPTPGGDTAQLNFTVNLLPNVRIPVVGPLCQNGPTVTLAGTPSGGVYSGQSVTASGVFTPSVTGVFPVKYKVTTAAGCIDSASINITVNAPPTIHAGSDQLLCGTSTTVNLTGTGTNDSIVKWSGGVGTFSSSSTLVSVYTPNASEITTGSVTLTITATGKSPCVPISDQMVIKFTPVPTVNAGPDQKLCSTSTTVNLNGTAANDSIIKWTGGAGTFSSINKLNPVYTPSASELNGGTVTLTITGTGKSPCTTVSDQMVIKFTPAPSVNAGPDQKLCSTSTTVNLNGTTTNDSIVTWIGGTGTFSSINKLNPVYTPSASELNGGTISLTLTATGKSPCVPVSDQMVIKFTPAPSVNAGPDQKLCSTSTTVNLNGTAANDSLLTWTGGSGSFSSINELSPVYTPSTSELNGGTVTLTIIGTGKSPCVPVSDQMVIKFTPAPIVNAGPDQKLCSTSTTVNLNGTITNDSIVTWAGGAGTFSSINKLNPVYTPSASELNGGTVTLTITATGKSPCAPVSDQMVIKYTTAPSVNAGPDQKLCSTSTTVNLNGTAANDSIIKWSGGAGIFSSGSTAVTKYTPTASEITNGGAITLTIKGTGKSPCPLDSDQVVIVYSQQPAVNAGPDQKLCSTTSVVSLSGIVQNDSIMKWSGGAGTFSSDSTAISIYTPTSTEIKNGSVTLTLKVSGKLPCPALSDQIVILYNPIPSVNAGPDQKLCSTTTSLNLTGSSKNDSILIWSGGAGTFSSISSKSSIYNPTATEIASGAIILTLTVTGKAPCPIDSDQVVILYSQAPLVNAGPDQKLCNSGNTVNLNGSVQNDSIVRWSGGLGIFTSASMANSTYTPTTSEINGGSINLTLTVIGKSPCSQVSDHVVILVSSAPTVNAGPDQKLCNLLSTLHLNGTVQNDSLVVWSGGAGTFSSTSSLSSTYIPTASEINSGSITLILTVIGKSPCPQVSSQVTFTGIPVPKVNINDTSVCQGGSVSLNARPSNLNFYQAYRPVYSWYKNNIPLSNVDQSLQVSVSGLYKVSVSLGGCIGSDSMNFTVYPLPDAGLPAMITFCTDTLTSVVLTAGVAQSYLWKPGGETNQSIVVSNSGTYVVSLTNQYNCSATGNTIVKEVCPPRLFVGNAFSPNKDGINDVFTVYGVHIGKYQLLIFNRWGEIIFESTDIHFSWDGYYKGELMPIGVYPWIITYEGDSPEYLGPYQLDGSVTIVK